MTDNGNKKDLSLDQSDKGQFKEILSYIETTDLEEVLIESGGRKLSFKRTGVVPREEKVDAPVEEVKEEAPRYFSIKSPIVGRFHSSMGPDRPALVVEEGRVSAGQKVAIVEAMKIKKEVFSAVTGKVLKILVHDGDIVEYGQEIFRVIPDNEMDLES